jgi:hypothetical protein
MRQAFAPVVLAGLLLGALLGVLGARVVFVDSGLSLLPWALGGLAVGAAAAGDRWRTRAAGAAYGFALAYLFMLASYDGPDATATRLVPFLVFGVFGAVCGMLLALLGSAARVRLQR